MNTSSSPDISRRSFLVNGGITLAAASTLSRATAFGSAANSRIKIGLIGSGSRGLFLLNLIQEHGGYEIAAVADYFPDRVKLAGEKFNVSPARQFTGLKCAEKMIASGGLDAVAIISPPYFHPEQAHAAVEAGLHVWLAKPVAVDVPGCQTISESNEIARRKGLTFLIDFQTRANEFFIQAMQRIHSGAMGEVCFGEASYHCDRIKAKAAPGQSPQEARLRNWVFDQALSGDIIVEQNIHTLDVMSWTMKDSPPLRCTGTGGRSVRIDVGNAWDHYALAYEYPNQVGVTFSSRQFDAHGDPGGIKNHMFGTRGVLVTEYGGDVLIRGGKDAFYRGGATTGIYKEGAAVNLKAFHTAIMTKDTANVTVAPSVTSTLIAIMGRTAAQEKRTVTWDEIVASKTKRQADLAELLA